MKNDEQIWNSENLFNDFSPFQLSKHQQSFQYNQNIHAPVFIVQQTIPETEIDENLVEITLPGQLISIIRQNGGQANEEFILEKIKPFFPYLRRINGNKYCGKLEKTVIGGLHSSEIFNFEKEIGVWTVREELAKKYETRLMEKIKKMEIKLGKKGRKISKTTDNEEKKENSIPKKNQKKRTYKRSKIKYSIAMQSMEKIMDYMCEKNYTNLIKNPFMNIKGTESAEEMITKMGAENVIGMIRCYNYFKPLILSELERKNKLIAKPKPEK